MHDVQSATPRSVVQIGNLVNAVWDVQATDWMLPLFHALARKYAPVRVGETGFRGGTSAAAWLIAARDYGGHVYSMDIDQCEPGRQFVAELGLSRYHTFIQADSREGMFPEMLDILFIDGDHSAEGVKNDRERFGPLVRSGGVILYHDTLSEPSVGLYTRQRGIAEIPIGAGLAIEAIP